MTTTTTLADLCDLVSQSVRPGAIGANQTYLGLEHLAPGRLKPIGFGKVAEVTSNKSLFQRGDVLYGKLRPYLDKAVLADRSGVSTTELLVLRPKPGTHPEYLACLVHSPDFVDHAMAGVTGVQHPRTSWPHISAFPVRSMEDDEQRSISKLLWCIHDELLGCEAAESAAQALKRGAMREMFSRGLRGEPQRDTDIGLLPASWQAARLDAYADVLSTRWSYSALEKMTPSTDPDALTVYGIKVSDMNRRGNEVELREAALVMPVEIAAAEASCAPPNTVVFPKRGAAIATNKKRLTCTWTVFDPNVIGVRARTGLDQRYLFHWFQHFDLREITEPGPTPQLNKKNLEPLVMPVPPDLGEQEAIVGILDLMDRRIDLHRRKKVVLEELFKAVLHKLMTGEISVDDLDPSALPSSEEALA